MMTTKELAKNVYESFGNGNLPGILEVLDAEIEWELVGPKEIPYFGKYVGHEGVSSFFQKLVEHEDVLEFVPEKFIEEGNSLAVLGKEKCRSRATGKEFSVSWVQIFEAHNGKITRWTEYIDTEKILRAYQ